MDRTTLAKAVLSVTPSSFEALALAIFQYQAKHNQLYADYLRLLGLSPKTVTKVTEIPFLPIQFFKKYSIKTKNWSPDVIFRSSGTTGNTQSQHFVRELPFYTQISQVGFERFYGSLSNYCFLALLPAYLERQDSSLVYMASHFIEQSPYPQSGFFLDNYPQLVQHLKHCQAQRIPTILIGVSFALLDLAEQFPMDLSQIIFMETGGMKGRRKEITREELHRHLKNAFQCNAIHSEYGMTELLSQAYSKGQGIFQCTPSMRVLIREITDPFSLQKKGKAGGINVIDLANLDSCSFIAIEDIGRLYDNNQFEVLGRFDHSDIRGCNLMLEL